MDAMEGILTILLTFGTLFAIIVGGIFIWALKILKGGSPRQNKQLQKEEAQLIQEMYQGLSKMEARVEALEAILWDQEKKKVREEDQ